MATRTTVATEVVGTSANSITVGIDAFRTVPASSQLDTSQITDASNALAVSAQSCIVYPGTTITVAAATTYYKLRGYNTGSNQFEVWTSTDPYSSPPSLATLLDITFSEFDA